MVSIFQRSVSACRVIQVQQACGLFENATGYNVVVITRFLMICILIAPGAGGLCCCRDSTASNSPDSPDQVAPATVNDRPAPPAGTPAFDRTPDEFTSDAGDIAIVLPDAWRGVVTNVVFQVWSDTSARVEAPHTDRSPPFVYSAELLRTVPPGPGEIQAILRDADDSVVGSVRHRLRFVRSNGAAARVGGDTSAFGDLADTYAIESGRSVRLDVPQAMTGVTNVVFQVWSDASGLIEQPFLDRDPPFVYPAEKLALVTPGPAEVQALLRDADDRVVRSVRQRTQIIAGTGAAARAAPESINARFADEPATIMASAPAVIEVRVYTDDRNRVIDGLNVVFQSWVDGVGVTGAHTVRTGRFVYPAAVLKTVPDGPGEVQALVRDGNDRVLTRLRFRTTFVNNQPASDEPSTAGPAAAPGRADSNADDYQRPADWPSPEIFGAMRPRR